MKAFVQRHPVLRSALSVPRAIRRSLINARAHDVERLVSNLQSMIVGDVLIRVPEFDGDFYSAPTSHLFVRAIRDGYYEPELARLFLSHVRPDRDVVDVGANIGFFTVGAAKKLTTGRVLAVEPTNGAFQRLLQNIAKNAIEERVVLFHGLASDKPGEAEFHSAEGFEEYSSMQVLQHPSTVGLATRKDRIAASTVDELVAAHKLKPSIMKVDVEGAEGLVFAGSRETLKEFRPVILSELSNELLAGFGTSGREIVATIKSLGYHVTDPLDPAAVPGVKAFGDILCIPA